MSDIYHNYFAKDKPLRHYSQHLFIALLGFFSLGFFNMDVNFQNLFLILLGSLIIDLDGLISIFVFRKKIKEADRIVHSLQSLNLIEAATLATKHHKLLNRLLLHNIVGFFLLLSVIYWSLTTNQYDVFIISWAILFHFIFDIYDDLYQLGHIRNWLWPILSLRKLLQRNL